LVPIEGSAQNKLIYYKGDQLKKRNLLKIQILAIAQGEISAQIAAEIKIHSKGYSIQK